MGDFGFVAKSPRHRAGRASAGVGSDLALLTLRDFVALPQGGDFRVFARGQIFSHLHVQRHDVPLRVTGNQASEQYGGVHNFEPTGWIRAGDEK